MLGPTAKANSRCSDAALPRVAPQISNLTYPKSEPKSIKNANTHPLADVSVRKNFADCFQ